MIPSPLFITLVTQKVVKTPAAPAHASSSQPQKEYRVSTLSLDQKYELARSVGEECIQESELRLLLEKKPHPIVYDGFEPSGRMHIAQGVLRAINVNKLTKCGCVFKVSRFNTTTTSTNSPSCSLSLPLPLNPLASSTPSVLGSRLVRTAQPQDGW